MNDIDFVLTWVNPTDARWQQDRQEHIRGNLIGNLESHYRDWGTLKFWFRAVEKHAPWVRNIHFVTCGHYPQWLNINHPKIRLVPHHVFMKDEYLPTFSINPIELNLHNIPNLSEQFVYFNDDTFINGQVRKEDFFVNGLPCDSSLLSSLIPSVKNEVITYILFNDLLLINSNFNKRRCIRNNWKKWFSLKYTKNLIRNLYYLPIRKFPGFINPHLPNSFLRTTFSNVWQAEYDSLHETSKHKFRTKEDVNQYLMRYWQLATGTYIPRNDKFGMCYTAGIDNVSIIKALREQSPSVICINDSNDVSEAEIASSMGQILETFNILYPQKSEFEK